MSFYFFGGHSVHIHSVGVLLVRVVAVVTVVSRGGHDSFPSVLNFLEFSLLEFDSGCFGIPFFHGLGNGSSSEYVLEDVGLNSFQVIFCKRFLVGES